MLVSSGIHCHWPPYSLKVYFKHFGTWSSLLDPNGTHSSSRVPFLVFGMADQLWPQLNEKQGLDLLILHLGVP